MKIKDEIASWRAGVKKLEEKSIGVANKTATFFDEVKELRVQVEKLNKQTAEMSELMLSLIRIQMGD